MKTQVYFLVRLMLLIFFRLFFRLEIRGRENIPATGPFILAANHVSFLDPPALGCASPRPVCFFARSSLFANPLFAALKDSLGTIPLEREDGRSMALKKGLRALWKKQGLAIFPEGTRITGGALGLARPGVGFVAVKGRAPVVPVYVSGTHKAMPRHARFIWPAKIRVRIGAPLFFTSGSYEEIGRIVMEEIRKLKNEE